MDPLKHIHSLRQEEFELLLLVNLRFFTQFDSMLYVLYEDASKLLNLLVHNVKAFHLVFRIFFVCFPITYLLHFVSVGFLFKCLQEVLAAAWMVNHSP